MSAPVMIGARLDCEGLLAAVMADAALATDALSHHRAVVDAARESPLAPLRFGHGLGADTLITHAASLARTVRLAADHVEIGITLSASEQPIPAKSAVTGRDFLREASARARLAGAFPQQVAQIHDRIAALADVIAIRTLVQTDARASLAVCAPRACAAAVAVAVENMVEGAGINVVMSGPWPLYSFALWSADGAAP
jgi:Gas vesicle synthesis protein GvpL/GvpF